MLLPADFLPLSALLLPLLLLQLRLLLPWLLPHLPLAGLCHRLIGKFY